MTLIVAWKGTRGFYLVSDSRILDGAEINKHGTLKAIIINPKMCVCYAGPAAYALNAIRHLPRDSTIEAATKILFQSHIESEGKADYIVAGIDPGIVNIIKDGKVTNSAGWIGNEDAYAAYQKYYNEPPPEYLKKYESEKYNIYPEEIREMMRIKDKLRGSLSKVIDDDSVKSVGDYCISVELCATGLKYSSYSVLKNAKPVIGNTTEEQNLLIPGDTTDEGLNYCVLVPKEAGIGAIGVHFYQGNVGYLYHPQYVNDQSSEIDLDPPFQYSNVNFQEFIAIVKEEHGFELEGIPFSPEGGMILNFNQ